MAPYSENLRILVAKEETIPGTMETITSADFDIAVKDPTISGPTVEMDDESAQYARGDHAEHVSISGTQTATIAFSFLCAWGGAVTTAPKWAKFAYGCGLEPTTYAGTGWGLRPRKAYDNKSYTIWVYDIELGSSPRAIAYKYKGCTGKMTLGAEGMGKPWMLSFTFDGALADIVDVANASIPILNNIASTCSDKFLENTFTIDSVVRNISTWQLDTGNENSPLFDQAESTGVEAFYITKREPRFSCNPLAAFGIDDYGYLANGVTGCPQQPEISLAANNFTLIIPKAQKLSMAVASREGYISFDQTWKCGANGVTGSLADPDLEPEDTFELIQGSRT